MFYDIVTFIFDSQRKHEITQISALNELRNSTFRVIGQHRFRGHPGQKLKNKVILLLPATHFLRKPKLQKLEFYRRCSDLANDHESISRLNELILEGVSDLAPTRISP